MIVCLLVTAGINSDVSYLSFQIQVKSIFTSDSCLGKMKSLFQEGRGMREASLGYMSPCLKTKVKPTWRLPAQSALCSVRVRPPNGWLTWSSVSTTSSTFPETSSSKAYSIFPWGGGGDRSSSKHLQGGCQLCVVTVFPLECWASLPSNKGSPYTVGSSEVEVSVLIIPHIDSS